MACCYKISLYIKSKKYNAFGLTTSPTLFSDFNSAEEYLTEIIQSFEKRELFEIEKSNNTGAEDGYVIRNKNTKSIEFVVYIHKIQYFGYSAYDYIFNDKSRYIKYRGYEIKKIDNSNLYGIYPKESSNCIAIMKHIESCILYIDNDYAHTIKKE